MSSIVQAENVSVCYDGIHAVHGISFELQTGQILGIVGPNGSGKTTISECVAGLRRPTSGLLRVFNMDPFRQRKRICQRLGVQIQDTHYSPRLRVRDLGALMSSLYDNPANFDELLLPLGLMAKRNCRIGTLSGGQKQKLAIALALLSQPDLLILDEFTTGLDPEARHVVEQLLQKYRTDGTAMIIVSHYLDEIEGLADRILFLDRGMTEFHGTFQEFRDKMLKESRDSSAFHSLNELYFKYCANRLGMKGVPATPSQEGPSRHV